MRFFFRPLNTDMEFVETLDSSIEVIANTCAEVVIEAKRQNTFISDIHIKPDDPLNSKVIVSSIIDESNRKFILYLRNLDTSRNTNVRVTFVESIDMVNM